MNTFGKIEENTKVNGKIIKWMEMGFLYGLMEGLMKGSIKMTKNMDMVYLNGKYIHKFFFIFFILGLMEGCIKECGKLGSNMEKDYSLI